jgi:hypothetical protein
LSFSYIETNEHNNYTRETSQNAKKGPEQAMEDYTDQLTMFLSFKTGDLESEFSTYSANANLQRWRRSMSSVFGILSTMYVYAICKNYVDWTNYSENYKPEYKASNGTSNFNSLSIKGWYL